jgi:hypothetical protein
MGHHIVEVFLCHETVVVKIGLFEHCYELLFCHVFAQIFSYFLKISQAHFPLQLISSLTCRL